MLDDIREAMADIPGIVTSVEQPLAHLISAMLSGVQAQVAIKLYGDDLDVLRAKVKEMKTIVAGVPGVKDLVPEPQISIPQLRIELDRDQLARYGLTPGRRQRVHRNGHARQGRLGSAPGTADVRSVRAARRAVTARTSKR